MKGADERVVTPVANRETQIGQNRTEAKRVCTVRNSQQVKRVEGFIRKSRRPGESGELRKVEVDKSVISGLEVSLVGQFEVIIRSRVRPWESVFSAVEVNVDETRDHEAQSWNVSSVSFGNVEICWDDGRG